MGELIPRGSSASIDDSPETPEPPPLPPLLQTQRQQLSLVQPSQRKKHRPKVFRVLRSVFRTFPIITSPSCKIPVLSGGLPDSARGISGSKVTGTLFGYRRGRNVKRDPIKIRLGFWMNRCGQRFCNGKKSGYGVKREASEEDLNVMELLKAVSMGAGVLPGTSEAEGPDEELAYMRAHFERVVGSKDSETLYMISPEGDTGPELSIFFVRV
ncbi:PROTEIN MIZU-KUSSEI 1 [Salix viminalis]|uniref:PROTEIN MIZU-KUSSEI 1 n=1 Tax=Salix viminalis TaxID=40686 RepID=A0A9Q0ZJW1_SALVM|nr:PROTEIN MIZU-KUSSEI 1 [Salix viminalis]